MKMIWCGWKSIQTCHVLVNQFHGNFHPKTLSCRRIKSVFRDVKWCFNASWGLKGLMLVQRWTNIEPALVRRLVFTGGGGVGACRYPGTVECVSWCWTPWPRRPAWAPVSLPTASPPCLWSDGSGYCRTWTALWCLPPLPTASWPYPAAGITPGQQQVKIRGELDVIYAWHHFQRRPSWICKLAGFFFNSASVINVIKNVMIGWILATVKRLRYRIVE